MSIFDWYELIEAEALDDSNCSPKVERMFETVRLGSAADDPHIKIRHLEESKAIAVQLDNAIMALWADISIFRVLKVEGEFSRSYDLGVRAALESRDKKYSGTPLGIMANNLLTGLLATRDPHGLKSEIESACIYLDEVCPPESDHACICYGTMIDCWAQLGEFNRSREYVARRQFAAEQYFAKWGKWFYMAQQHCGQAHLAHFEGDWDEVLCQADCGLSDTLVDGNIKLALLALRANALARKGETAGAAAAYRRVSRNTDVYLDHRCYDAMTDYWLAIGKKQKAVEVRLEQQKKCDGKGRHWEQACGALHLIELYETETETGNVRIWTEKLRAICENLKRPWHPKFASRLCN